MIGIGPALLRKTIFKYCSSLQQSRPERRDLGKAQLDH